MGDVYAKVAPFVEGADEGRFVINAVVETPRGSRNKFTYDPKLGIFEHSKVLPAGMVFPFDFGFVPGTLGEDGDPLDVLVMLDEPVFTGCLVHARLIGVLEVEQTERDGRSMRNDRLVAVSMESHANKDLRSIHELSDELISEVEHFFVSYNEQAGKVLKVLGRYAAEKAREVVLGGVVGSR